MKLTLLLNSPTPSLNSFTIDDQSSILNSTPITLNATEPLSPVAPFHSPAPVSSQAVASDNSEVVSSNDENNVEKNDSDNVIHSKEHKDKDEHKEKLKAEKKAAKKLMKELTICKIILEEMEVSFQSSCCV